MKISTTKKIDPLDIHLVVDMDETLVHTFEYGREEYDKFKKKHPKLCSELELSGRLKTFTVQDVVNERGKGEEEFFWFIKRPNLDNFILWGVKEFKSFSVWSAGQKRYVEEVINILFEDYKGGPTVLLTHDDTEKYKGYSSKPLEKIYKKIKGADETNTYIIDDVLSNFYFHNTYNGILIPQYEPEATMEDLGNEDDTALDNIMDFFEYIEDRGLEFEDVRNIEKRNMFENFSKGKDIQPPPIKNGKKYSVEMRFLSHQDRW